MSSSAISEDLFIMTKYYKSIFSPLKFIFKNQKLKHTYCKYETFCANGLSKGDVLIFKCCLPSLHAKTQ